MPNPYNFVRISKISHVKERPNGHHMFQGHSGILSCRLIAKTMLFTSSSQQGEPLRFPIDAKGKTIIPGSSLKGMIRSVAEAASSSCISLSGELFDRRGRVESRYKDKIRDELSPCKSYIALCLCCSMFGMVGQGDSSHPTQPNVFKGKVSIGQAKAGNIQFAKPVYITLMNPKPTHHSFYSPSGKVAGRKFYYHRPLGIVTDTTKTKFNKQVVPVEAGAEFIFDVAFRTLTESERSLLLYALFLEENLCHKLGMGKPLGFGSCQILPLKMLILDESKRYRELNDGQEEMEGSNLYDFIAQETSSYRNSQEPYMKDIQKILLFNQGDTLNYRYPGRDWFKQNSQASIDKVP